MTPKRNYMGPVHLSVVIPAYNEEGRLPATLDEIRPWLDAQSYSYEVIVIDDGSKDGTVARCKNFQKSWRNFVVVEQGDNIGKGAAVRRGCLMAKGEYVLVMDADHASTIDTLDFFFPHCKNHDLVVGVRAFAGTGLSNSMFRRIVGLIQQLLAHLIVFVHPVADSQCGFKLFSRTASREIFKRVRIDGGMFDVEVFVIAQRLKYDIYSQPVRWNNKPGSNINMVRCILFDPLSLFYIRFLDLIGRYR
jgi:dolichyl-phosphate beta-glucosyltransferase